MRLRLFCAIHAASFWLCGCATDRYRKGFDYAHVIATSGWRTHSYPPDMSVSYWVDDGGDSQLSAIYTMYRAAELTKENRYLGFFIASMDACGEISKKKIKRFEPERLPKAYFDDTRCKLEIVMSHSADVGSHEFYVAEEVLGRLEPYIKR